jgi:hypothetical protein
MLGGETLTLRLARLLTPRQAPFQRRRTRALGLGRLGIRRPFRLRCRHTHMVAATGAASQRSPSASSCAPPPRRGTLWREMVDTTDYASHSSSMVAFAGRLATRVAVHFGVISRARNRQRRRRAVAVGGSVAVAAAAIAALTTGGGQLSGGSDRAARLSATTAVRHLRSGHSAAAFSLREPAGVVLLARISAPRGVRAFVNAAIPGVAGVRFGTGHSPGPLSLSCAVHGARTVCTEAVEWCPMPKAAWRFHVTKSAGPAGDVRVDFVVGPKPHNSSSAVE